MVVIWQPGASGGFGLGFDYHLRAINSLLGKSMLRFGPALIRAQEDGGIGPQKSLVIGLDNELSKFKDHIHDFPTKGGNWDCLGETKFSTSKLFSLND